MESNKINVIGLGEIGLSTFNEIDKIITSGLYGTDINIDTIKKLHFTNVGTNIKKSSIYIICVYSSAQVFEVLQKIDKSNHPLIVIESTIEPGTYQKLKSNDFDLVVFPHRYNPGDKQHHIFNLSRVIGGETNSVNRAKKFYSRFMDIKLLHTTTGEIAELSKVVENAYRFIEIAIAEELKMLCDEKNINFESLRVSCNTKWNISIMEARTGIEGRCLPKDMELLNGYFTNNILFKVAAKIDRKYNKVRR